MNIIQAANPDILPKLERMFWNFLPDIEYKIASYVIKTEAEDGTALLFNDMTKEIVSIDKDENIFTQFFLIHLFIVPKDFNDTMLPLLMREVYESQRSLEIDPYGYVILTTTACNARCFYCYEKGKPQKPMTEKTANDVADFLIKNYNRHKDNGIDKPVRISWFGGEPLFRKRCISIICGRMKDGSVPYISTMISNGYLFNEDTVKEAKELWNLDSVQITVDGTKDVYNDTKNYIYKNKNAYETVLGNIQRLTDNGIKVSIRINVGMFNVGDVEALIEELCWRFYGNKLVSIYPHGLYDNDANDNKSESDDKLLWDSISAFSEKIKEKGLSISEKAFDNTYASYHCMSDSCRNLCILTDGRLTLCEHYIDSNVIGTIYEFPNNVDKDMVRKYHEVKKPYPQCYGCPLIMDCTYLAVCSDANCGCTSNRKQHLINRYKRRVAEKYDEVKERHLESAVKKMGTD